MRIRAWVAGVVLCAAGVAIGQAGDPRGVLLEVTVTRPVQTNDTVSYTIFTPGGDAPDTLPVGVRSEVSGDETPTSVVTALGGTLDSEAGELVDELEAVEATLVNETLSVLTYEAVIDAANLDFVEGTRGTPGLFAEDVIRTLAIIDGFYTDARDEQDVVAVGAIGIDVAVLDSEDVDADGNGIPDATALLSDDFVLIDNNGVVTIVRSIDADARGTETNVVEQSYESQDGPVRVTVESPTLGDLQGADSDFDAFNTARLIVSIAGDAGDLVDEPSGANPVSDFDLEDVDGPLPRPENVFVRATIAVANVSRGATPNWTFVDQLPAGLEYFAEISGPGVAELLEDGFDVGAYVYNIEFVQDGEDITAESDDTSEWDEADNLTLDNEDNSDDDADSRVVEAQDGDDTVRATFSTGTAIFGSNAAPRADTGGGGGGGNGIDLMACFIATAAYGTPMAAQIDSLREVRDEYLIDNALGTAFVDTYYRVSPPVANAVAEYPVLKQAVRMALAPVVVLSGWTMAAPGTVAAMAIAIMILGAALMRRFRRPLIQGIND